MHVAAIIVAAGRGERAAAGQPKQFVDLGGGQTMLDLSLAAFVATPEVTEVVVAGRDGLPADAWRSGTCEWLAFTATVFGESASGPPSEG